MCKVLIGTENFPITINGSKVHIPNTTRATLVKELNKTKTHTNIFYRKEIQTGKNGFSDAFGGLTISIDKWQEMVETLKLTLTNEKNQEKKGNLPSFAA